VIALFPTSAAAGAACDDVFPQPVHALRAKRGVTAEDLIGLREIGEPDGSRFGLPSPLAVSPDGQKVAFVMTKADPAANGYCRALVVLALEAGAKPIVADVGGDPIPATDVQQGFIMQTGGTAVDVPAWSPDGQSLAYRKRVQGRTQAWIVAADGSAAHQVTNAPADVEALSWSDAQHLVYAARTDRVRAEAAIDVEGQSGWLYDARISPEMSPRPRAAANDVRSIYVLDIATGIAAPASPDTAAAFPAEAAAGVPAPLEARSANGQHAWTEQRDPSPLSPRILRATAGQGRTVECGDAACSDGIVGLWWAKGGRGLLFLRREGWAKGEMALYSWAPGGAPTARILRTSDVLQGCTQAAAGLLCLRENSTTPRRLVLIDERTGNVRILFDPNPEFAEVELGRVERLTWRNNLGLEAWGDLVLPPRYKPGSRLPMIVVQYHSDGFLRGGTGDEYPIFLFAAHGFAVLSVERTPFFAAAFPDLKSWYEINTANQKNWAERRSLLSSVETGVDLAIAKGVADPQRVGITGLSDGASTVAFALINSRKFAASAMSSCCMEPNTVMTYGGIAWADWLRGMGYPAATAHDTEFWRPASIALNAARIDTPILMQLADREYLLALEAFTALREQGKPVEMYVFPDEFHIKWQPAHRLAVYRRNLDWFSFWLQGREDPDPAKAAQYERWHKLSSLRGVSAVSTMPEARPPRRPTP
jgi:dipeptidyl aminopeptidase/acylaminoacyl peptidase